MQDTIGDYYSGKILTLEAQLKKIKKVFTYLYLIRFITFVSFVAFLVLFFHFDYQLIFLIISSISLISFLFAVKIDLNYNFKVKFLSNKLLVNQNELRFLEHHYEERETGEEYNYLNPHLAADFDLFGKGSLFQYLNRCSTRIGKTILAEGLCHLQKDERLIKEKQQAVKELSGKNEFIQDFQANGMFISENGSELTSLQSWLDQSAEKNNWLPQLCIIMPLINVIWIALIVFGIFSLNSFLFPLLISFFILRLNVKKINKAHSLLGKTAETFEKYTSLFKLTEEEEFKSAYLTMLKKQLSDHDLKAGVSLTSLFKLLNAFDLRFNMLVSFVANALLLYDIQIYLRLAKWKEKNKNAVQSWFNALSEIDALISLSVFAYNNRDSVSFPTISDNDFTFQAKEMGHPLLNHSVRICNDINFSGTPKVMIITGANMAGKSTFLRTLSVNLILAMNGAPVCAKDFVFTPCDIMPSIKIQDSLSNNESYFYAELLRIKDIIDHAQANPGTLVVLDEILRGTNTKDKHLGSWGLVEKLISLNAVVMIATHDLEIGELENKYPDIVVNHCFEVELTNDQLIFDYKLKNGVSKKLNASFLMKKMGIIS